MQSIVGQDFRQFIDPHTGHWANPDFVVMNFQQMFEDRIKYLFGVDL